DRMVETLTETAHQSIHLGQPAEALGLTRYAAALTTMSPATQVGSGPYNYVQGISAVGRAMLGEAGRAGPRWIRPGRLSPTPIRPRRDRPGATTPAPSRAPRGVVSRCSSCR
ncbi:MAG TPA: hypothetical protein VGM75_08705, partial [Pseudonocardiaceae bacterium]